MDISPLHPSSWPFFLSASFPLYFTHHPDNHVRWTETPEHHIFSADLPGVRKEDLRVELEDSLYMIIRTVQHAEEPAKRFMRKFRLPERVDLGGISAGYVDGVLTVTVPRSHVRRRHRIHPADLPDARDRLLARAA